MRQEKKDQNPKPQHDEKQRTNTPTGGREQTPGQGQQIPPKQNPPRPSDVDEEDQEMDPRQRRPA
jgi:hypothetical protein